MLHYRLDTASSQRKKNNARQFHILRRMKWIRTTTRSFRFQSNKNVTTRLQIQIKGRGQLFPPDLGPQRLISLWCGVNRRLHTASLVESKVWASLVKAITTRLPSNDRLRAAGGFIWLPGARGRSSLIKTYSPGSASAKRKDALGQKPSLVNRF